MLYFLHNNICMEPSRTQSPVIPIAIVVGFTLIALAIFFTGRTPATSENGVTENVPAADTIRPVTADDYIFGNPNAPIVMIEYSDYDCPFCKQYHATMHQIMDEYGVGGQVAWVYRQFPLVDIHPNAPEIAEAALCVGDLGGNDAFWEFSDAIFDSRIETEFTNVTLLDEFALSAGVNVTDFQSCMNDDRMLDRLKADMSDGLVAGAGAGTPYTVIKLAGQEATITGARDYTFVKNIVESLIGQLEGVDASNPTSVQ